MRFIQAAVAAVLCLFAGAAFAEMPKDLLQLQVQVLTPTVRIGNACSGQLVYSKRDEKSGDVRTLVLTAAHCTPEGGKSLYSIIIPVYDAKNRLVLEKTYPAKFVAKAFKADAALLELKDKGTWFDGLARIAPADTQLFQGEAIIAAGYPKALELTVTTGLLGPLVETNELDGELREYYRGTPNLAGGSSGGGLYHKNASGDWELIGISCATFPTAFFMSLFLPIENIHAFLRTAAPEVVKAATPSASK